MTELYDEDLYQAFGEIDPRKWATKLRIVAVIRREQRLSREGIAHIGNHELARRAKSTSQYVWKLTGTGKSSPGVMWRVDRVLEVVEKGRGSRGTGYRVRPIEMWRNVPWLEEQREIRRLTLVDGHQRADERDAQQAAEEAPSRPQGATQHEIASRSYGATLDAAASRWRTRRYLRASTALRERDANPENGATPPLVVVADVPSAPPGPQPQEEEESNYLNAAQAALHAKTGGIAIGRIEAQIRLLEQEGVELEWLTRAINQADARLGVPKIIESWIPFARKNGLRAAEPPRSIGVAEFVPADELAPADAEHVAATLADARARLRSGGSEAMSAPRGTMDTP